MKHFLNVLVTQIQMFWETESGATSNENYIHFINDHDFNRHDFSDKQELARYMLA